MKRDASYYLEKARSLLAREKGPHAHAPRDILAYLEDVTLEPQEHFILLTLNGANEITGRHTITKGLANRTLVHPREVFRQAISSNAVSIIIAHNHPSGNVNPSIDDDNVTQRLVLVGELVGIPVLDHLIISPGCYFSYVAEDRLNRMKQKAKEFFE